jgi:hypothetical protein
MHPQAIVHVSSLRSARRPTTASAVRPVAKRRGFCASGGNQRPSVEGWSSRRNGEHPTPKQRSQFGSIGPLHVRAVIYGLMPHLHRLRIRLLANRIG